MPSRVATYADAITAWINDRTARNWPAGISNWRAERVWEATLEIQTTDGLSVQLVPMTRRTMTLATRQTKDQPYDHEIYIREKYTEANAIPNDWIDLRVWLVESMEDQLFDLSLTPAAGADRAFVPPENGVTIDLLCDPLDLEQFRQFTAQLTVTVQELRTR